MQRNGSFLTGFDNKILSSENWNLYVGFMPLSPENTKKGDSASAVQRAFA